MSVAAIITEGIGPGGTVPFLLMGGLSQGKAPVIFVGDTHDDAKKHDKRARRLVKRHREKNELRTQQVIAAFEQVIEGKPIIPVEVAETIVKSLEVNNKFTKTDFADLQNQLNVVQALWNEYLANDDEDVILML